MRKVIVIIAAVLAIFPFTCFATINTGDIAVIGFNCDGGSGLDKNFTVVTLASITGGETFYVTDRGISGGIFNNSFTSEGTFSFSVTTTIPAGTVIMFTVTSGSSRSVVANPSSYGSISIIGSGWTATIPGNSPWDGIGDQILIYQTGPVFIFGFNNTSYAGGTSNGWHTGSSTGAAFSNIPPGLTNGTNAIGFIQGTHLDNVVYNGTKTGNKSTLLAAITNAGNWSKDDNTPYDLSPGGTNFAGANPIFSFATLPVHLLSFTGTSNSSNHQLSWNVQNEENFDYYEIEISADASLFTSIGRVIASGKERYSFINVNPGNGRSYYRLKMVSMDGSFTYSKVVTLLGFADKNNILIYPNPVLSTVNFSSKNKITKIIITDVMGRNILSTVVNANTSSLDLQKLRPGIYQAHIQTNEGTIIQTITKSQ